MTDQPTTTGTGQAAVTIATALYEASSLLNTHAELPAPTYVTAMTFDSGTARVQFSMDTPDGVRAWADAAKADLETARGTGTETGSHGRPFTVTRAHIGHPFDGRITVDVSAIVYDGDK